MFNKKEILIAVSSVILFIYLRVTIIYNITTLIINM